MKKLTALALAGCMAVSLAACGGSASTTPASSEAASTESAATSAAESAAESVTEATQGGKVGVCIYKFDDAFMTTYRNALQEILEGKGYEVTMSTATTTRPSRTSRSTPSSPRALTH